MRTLALAAVATASIGLLAPIGCEAPDLEQGEPPPVADLAVSEQAWVSCDQWIDMGYVDGTPFPITVVTVDDRPVEIRTANAYAVMQEAAAADGVELRVVSGFRTYSQQEYLYGCYQCCCCNNCNLAAPPGYSNHQSGHALDLNTSSSGVLSWLNNHGASYGFERTVPSEDWHWEWWEGGPGGGPCDLNAVSYGCTVTETGETGECMDTTMCAELGGDHVSTAGYCPGPSTIQCCTGSTPCTVTETGETGECEVTSVCSGLGEGYVSTPGYCPGPSYNQCCTAPTPPPEDDAGLPDDDAGLPDDDAGLPDDDAGLPDDDAGPPEDDPEALGGVPGDSDGCGCRLAPGADERREGAWLFAVLLGTVTRRRVRRPSARR